MSQTRVVERIRTHCNFNNVFIWNRSFYGIMWKNIVERVRS